MDIKNNTIKVVSSSKITEVLATCAFGFALVSFLSTAFGLNDFAFQGAEAWKGFLLSFCIQGSLLTLNLNMLRFLSHLDKLYQDSGLIRRVIKGCIIIFYVAMLTTSSFFSGVFITNLSYEHTYIVDTHAIAEKAVRQVMLRTKNQMDKANLNLSDEIRSALNDMQDSEVIAPYFSKMSFNYNLREIAPPNEIVQINDSRDSVPINNVYAREDANIILRYREVNAARESLYQKLTSLNELNDKLDELSGNNIRDRTYEKKLVDAQGIAQQLIVEISDYHNIIEALEDGIDTRTNAIKEHQKKYVENKLAGLADEDNYEGWNAYIKGLEIEYLTIQKNDYMAFIGLVNYEDKQVGELQGWYDILTQMSDSRKLLALFVDASIALKDEGIDNVQYKEIRSKLYSAVQFVTSYGSSGWSYQEFDKKYTEYEITCGASRDFEKIYDDVAKINIPTHIIRQHGQLASVPDGSSTPNTADMQGNIPSSSDSGQSNDIEILNNLSNTTDDEWRTSWNEVINKLHKNLLTYSSIDENNSNSGAVTLMNLHRDHFSDLSSVELAIKRLYGPYPGKARFAFLFAFVLDVASFGIGLIICLRSRKITIKSTTIA